MGRMGRRSIEVLAAATLAMAGLAPGESSAEDRTYMGTWAAKRAQCRLGQDRQDAPLVLTRNGYDQHETHCRFGSVRAQGKDTWRVPAKCSVQGDAQSHTFTFTVAGSRLTIRDRHGVRALRRCG
jgi:hypothetical protein